MGDTALISTPKTCDVHDGRHEARYDAAVAVHWPKSSRRQWGNVCEEAFHSMDGHLGTGRGQRLVVVTHDEDYRGYRLGLMPTGDVVILANGDYIDTAASIDGAKSRIDDWKVGRWVGAVPRRAGLRLPGGLVGLAAR